MNNEKTNEELAALIQAGHDEYIERLWRQLEKFITQQAEKRFSLSGKSYPEVGDLISAGYFAMLEAIKYYKPDKDYKFITYLGKTLQKAFASEYGLRGKRDSLCDAVSLDEPIGEDNLTIEDTVADETAELELYSFIERERAEGASELINQALSAVLSERERETILLFYFSGKTYQDIGSDNNQTRQNFHRLHRQAVWKLKRCSYTKRLKELYCDFPEVYDWYNEGFKHTGLQYFRDTGMSSVERIAILREALEKKKQN